MTSAGGLPFFQRIVGRRASIRCRSATGWIDPQHRQDEPVGTGNQRHPEGGRRADCDGLDLNPHPIQQKQLSAKKMKELRIKIEDRTITKAEYEQYIWNKKFAKHRASSVTDFWYQERRTIK